MHPPFKTVEASRRPFPLTGSDTPAFELSQTPDPNWKPGQGLNSLPLSASHRACQPRRELDPDAMTGVYKALISGVTPRPIAFVSTVSADGVPNLAPYSFFNLVSASPPLVSVSITSGATGAKDTYANIVDTGDFTVSMISETFLESANYTAVDSPASVSEWDLSGLTPVPSSVVKPARVGESVFAVECTLHHQWAVTDDDGKETGGHVVFGRIRRIHVLESAWDSAEGVLKLEESAIVSRLGGIQYGRLTQGCELPRAVWADEKNRTEVQDTLA